MSEQNVSLDKLMEAREVLKLSKPTVINVGDNVFKNHKRSVLSLVQCSIATDMWGDDAFAYFAKALDLELKILEEKNPKFTRSHVEIITDKRKNRIHVSHMWKFRPHLIGAIQSVLTDMTGKSEKVYTKKVVKVVMDFTGIDYTDNKISGAIIFSESGNQRSAGRGTLFVRHFFTYDRKDTSSVIRTSPLSKELKSLNESINVTWDRNINVLFYNIKYYGKKNSVNENGENVEEIVSVVDAAVWSASVTGNISQPIVKEGLLIQRHDEPLTIALDVFKNISEDWLVNTIDKRSNENALEQLCADFENVISARYYEVESPGEFTDDLREALLYKLPAEKGTRKERRPKSSNYDETSSSIGDIIKYKSPEVEEDISSIESSNNEVNLDLSGDDED